MFNEDFICIPSFKANSYRDLALSKILNESLLQLSLHSVLLARCLNILEFLSLRRCCSHLVL